MQPPEGCFVNLGKPSGGLLVIEVRLTSSVDASLQVNRTFVIASNFLIFYRQNIPHGNPNATI
ncbi:MAG: hypothetical protein C0417_09155 [Chlorobiaceae bacterium]|nr:hypothetical protein [Chlorobiaceae bacterium]